MTLKVSTGARSDVGRVREHNEDACLVTDRICAVADGMGGHAAGEVASALAIEALAELAAEGDDAVTVDALVEAIQDAHERIRRSGEQHVGQRGMGTTLTGVALVQHEDDDLQDRQLWAVFNVGDSRVYRLSDGALQQVTVDHSEVQELLDAGVITAEEAAVHPVRNVITRSLGMPARLVVDVWLVPIESEQTFVICSDGLTNEVDDASLAALLSAEPDSEAAAHRLVEEALGAGGHDNVTVIVLRAERT